MINNYYKDSICPHNRAPPETDDGLQGRLGPALPKTQGPRTGRLQVCAGRLHRPCSPVGTTHLNLIRLGVPPVELPLLYVQGQAVGPAEGRVHQDVTLLPIQVGTLDFGVFPPVRPVHEAGEKAHVRDRVHLSCPCCIPRAESNTRPYHMGGARGMLAGGTDPLSPARPPREQCCPQCRLNCTRLEGAHLLSSRSADSTHPKGGPRAGGAELREGGRGRVGPSLLQMAEGLPCAKQVTWSVWLPRSKTRSWGGCPQVGGSCP